MLTAPAPWCKGQRGYIPSAWAPVFTRAPWERVTEPLLKQCLWTWHSTKAAEHTETARKKKNNNRKNYKSPLKFRENESTVAKKYFGASRLQALIAVWPKQTCSHSYFSLLQQNGKIIRNCLAPRLASQQTGQGPANCRGVYCSDKSPVPRLVLLLMVQHLGDREINMGCSYPHRCFTQVG